MIVGRGDTGFSGTGYAASSAAKRRSNDAFMCSPKEKAALRRPRVETV
jgi:hypothetical protein